MIRARGKLWNWGILKCMLFRCFNYNIIGYIFTADDYHIYYTYLYDVMKCLISQNKGTMIFLPNESKPHRNIIDSKRVTFNRVFPTCVYRNIINI